MHPGQTAGDETHAAFGRRCIPAEPRRFAPLIVAFRSEYTRYSSLTRLVSRAPHRPRRSRGFHHRLFTASFAPLIVALRSEYTGIPPSRALSAGRLTGLGAHVGSTTGCSPRRFAPLIVALRSKYTRYSSLARLVSRAPPRSRCSPHFVQGLLTPVSCSIGIPEEDSRASTPFLYLYSRRPPIRAWLRNSPDGRADGTGCGRRR